MPKRIDSASRFMSVSPPSVYAAFADPRAMAQWLPPTNMTATMLHFDFREGGGYRMRLTYKDREGRYGKTSDNEDEVEVQFVKIIDGQRIEETVTFASDDPAFSGVMRMIWTFDAVEDGTLVTIRAEDVPSGIQPEDHAAGMNSTLDNLTAFLIGQLK